MSRLKLTAMAALLAIPLAACNEGTPPPPEGTIDGQVSIEGQGLAGVSVSLSDGTTQTTGTDGRFAFTGVEGGTYTVSISGFAADATFASTSQTATIASQGQTVTVNFTGTYVRTASILGSVTVEGDGQSGIAVRLSGVSDASTTTDASGRYAFTGLRAGAYEVAISGFDADAVGFSSTSKGATVDVGESQVLSFDGTYLRTAGIVGRVSVEGDGLAGVTVSLSGSESRTATTDQAGQYAFNELRAGTYQVGISGFDADDYEFSSTSQSVTVTLGQTANVPFDGTLLRTAGISGRVSVEGMALADVTVMLTGAATDTAMTNADGQYAFTGLAAGAYMVAISGYNMDAYAFAAASMSVTLADDESNITNFMGTHTRSANVWGYLYFDANANDEYDGEENDARWHMANMTVTLEGPGVGESQTTMTDAMGMYKFDSLSTGTYKVLSAAPDSMLTRLGIGFGGLQSGMVVNVAAGSGNALHLPFDIKRQTIKVSAKMGDGKGKIGASVKDVEVMLYPTYQAASTNTGALGTAKTDSMGVATFTFQRAADTGPARTPDYLVFAKVGDLPHAVLQVSGNAIQEVSYPARSQEAEAANPVTMLNRQASFRFMMRSLETRAGGGGVIQGWQPEIVVTGRKATPNAGLKVGTSSRTGVVTFSDLDNLADLPTTYHIGVGDDTPAATTGGERYEGSAEPAEGQMADSAKKKLVYVNDGMQLPGTTANLGTLRVKYTTQQLTIAFHMERNQQRGYTPGVVGGGDVRPSASRSDLSVTLEYIDANGNNRPYKYPDGTHSSIASTGATRSPNAAGFVTYRMLPANIEFSLDFNASGDTESIGDDQIETYFLTEGRAAETRNKANRGSYSVGAFGAESGSGPVVYLCPLATASLAGGNLSNCSTFAFDRTDGSITGQVQTLANADQDSIVVTLTPSPANMGSTARMTSKTGRGTLTSGQYMFEGLGSGQYTISVASTAEWGSATPAKTRRLYTNDASAIPQATFTLTAENFQMRFLKTEISGTVVNDVSIVPGGANDDMVQFAETVQGAELTLFEVVRLARARGSVTHDTVATNKTATTNVEGEFAFEDVPEGSYIVQGTNTAAYELRSKDEFPYHQSPTVATTAAVRSVVSGTALPAWSYGNDNTNKANVWDNTVDADFIVLHKTGNVKGTVKTDILGPTDPDTLYDDPVSGIRLVARLCSLVSSGNVGTLRECVSPDTDRGVVNRLETTTNAKGEYSFSNMREGYWIIDVDSESHGDYDESSVDGRAYNQAALLAGPRAGAILDFILVQRP